jgi:anti-sigma factor RsiW
MSERRQAIEPEEIMAYLDGELASGRAAEAMTHLDRCPECQRLAAGLRRVSQELTAWQVETPALLAPAMENPKPSRRPLWRVLPAWAFAPAAAALMLGVVLIPRNERRSIRVGDAAAAFSVDRQPVTDQVIAGSRLSARFAPLPLPVATPPPQAGDQIGTTAPGPMIERTAQLTLTTHDFDQLRARIDAILARHHGYLAQLTVNAPETSGRSLNANLRIPAAQLEYALAEFEQLGRVESESQNGQDVSKQYVDLSARLANARNTAQRLTQLLAQRTGKLSDVLAVETELGRVQGEIEQMEAERKNTESQVAYAALQLNVSEYYKAQLRVSPDSTLLRFRNAAIEGYRSVADGIIGAALFIVAYAPSALLLAALLFFPVRALWRRYLARSSGRGSLSGSRL